MPATKWDTELLEAKSILLGYEVDPNDAQHQIIVRGYRGLSYSSAVSLKTTLDAQTQVVNPVIDGEPFIGTWKVSKSEISRIENGVLAGSHEVRQSMKYGVNTACMSVVNERLVRSRAYPLEQNENAWMYYELMQKEETKKWVNLTYAAAVAEYEYLWKIYSPTDLTPEGYVREHQIFYASANRNVANNLYYPGYKTIHSSLIFTAGKYYRITAAYLSFAYKYYPMLTEITNPVFETWYEEERDNTYTMYRTLKETIATPIMRNRVLQYAGMARVKGIPVVGDGTITIYGLNDDDAVIYEHTKFRIGNDVYRVKADCSSEEEGGITVWKPTITPEVTEATDELVDAGDTDQTQVYFAAL